MSSSESIDYYAILEVAPDSDSQAIRAAYQVLAQVWHPDRFAHNEVLRARAEERMKLVNAAYQVLSDPVARSRFDSLRTASAHGEQPHDGVPTGADHAAQVERVVASLGEAAMRWLRGLVALSGRLTHALKTGIRRQTEGITRKRALRALGWLVVWLLLVAALAYPAYLLGAALGGIG